MTRKFFWRRCKWVATLQYWLTAMLLAVLPAVAQDILVGRVAKPKVLVINYDPIIEGEGNKRLHDACRWNDPRKLTEGYINDIKESSGGYVQYQVVEWKDVDAFPVKHDLFRYTDESYLQCFRTGKGWHQPDAVDYKVIIKDWKLDERVEKGEIDEVWLWGAPYFGYWESTMAGKGAYWCNSPPVQDVNSSRIFVIMGFNYERGVGEMLEDFGHRTESILWKVYGRWDNSLPFEQLNAWERFTLYDKQKPGQAACGNVHFAPNSVSDYDWGNKTKVWSTCDDWLAYPHLTGKKRLVDSSEWGSGDIREHHSWWLRHLPKAPDRTDGKLNNWWNYITILNPGDFTIGWMVRVKNLKTLVVIYRGQKSQRYLSDNALAELKNGIELARLFYFRNSSARLNVELHYLVVDAPAPNTDGPSLENVVEDLKARGVDKGDYDGIFVTAPDVSGNFGGFDIFGGSAAAMSYSPVALPALLYYPDTRLDVNYDMAWLFTHEFQHAIDLIMVPRSGLNMLHGHPYTDQNEPFFKGNYIGGEHWDWIACTFRNFNFHDWVRVRAVRDETLECVDVDEDGFADDDPRLPMDEKRFGSDASKKDTDGDGLDDLKEFTADIYRGSHPRKTDTDEDGVPDGEDFYPTVAIAPVLPFITKQQEARRILDGAYVRNDVEGQIEVYGGWDDSHLYFRFVGPRPFFVEAKIDGSAHNGFWEGGDTYLFRFDLGEVKFNGLGLEGPVPGATATSYPLPNTTALQVVIPAKIGQGVSREINWGGKRDPKDVVDGLTLVEGRTIAVNFIYEFKDGTRAVLTPHHTMFAMRLVKSPPDEPKPEEGRVLEIEPSNWDSTSSWWDQYGPAYEGNPAIADLGATHTHAFGYGVGQFTYHFSLSDVASVTTAEIEARLSSEFPWYSGPPDGYSDVTLIINGETYESKRVISDNGSGRTYTWEIRSADLQNGDNTISFAVLANSSYRNGLCIYYKGVAPGAISFPIKIRIWGKMTARLPSDVNGDGVVNLIDLTLVAQALGTKGKGLHADVNGDGVVNISDLVMVAAHFGERSNPNAPAAFHWKNNLQAEMIERWLRSARAADDGSELFRRGIAILESFLNAIVPQKAALLTNFPNPFNSETWIPYQLSEPSEVKITIYDAQGRVVKRLDLGLKQAGLYRERTRAAYWDGRNEVGEPVASGVYFVELRTKGERLVRRIVLLK